MNATSFSPNVRAISATPDFNAERKGRCISDARLCNTTKERTVGNDTNRFRRFRHLDPGTFPLPKNLEVPLGDFIRCGRYVELGHLNMILFQSG